VTQAMKSGSADKRGWLLQVLLGLVFDHLGNGVPVVVGVKNAAAELVHSWPRLDVNEVGQLADIVHERLAAGPVLVVPPWEEPPSSLPGGGVRRGRVLQPEAVLLECRPVGPGSLLTAVMPESTFVSERARTVRESLAEYWQPVVVLYATGVIPQAHAGFGVAVAVFQARQHVAPVLRIFRVPDEPDPIAVEEDFRQLLAQRHERGRFGYAIRYPLPPGESLRFERHDPAMLARRADLAGYGEAVPLGELFELTLGVLAQNRDLFCEAGDHGAVRVLGGRDIRRDGTIAPPDDQSRWAQIAPDRQLRAGDLLVREIYHPTDQGGLIVADVTADDLPAAADHRVLVMRPREVLDAQHRLFATLFLRSPLARALTLGVGGGMHLRTADLRDLDLPLPDEALSAALDHVVRAGERLEAWRREAEGLLQSAFLDDSAATARQRIVIAGRKLRLRVEEAALVDDFGHFVRTRFPYPVALRWRRVQAYSGHDESSLAYREILDAAEILLSYSALLGLAISREEGITLGATASIRRRLASGRGPGLGDWRAILDEIGHSRAIQRLPGNHALHDLGSLMTNPNIDAARNRLNNRRNDEAHQRHVDPVDMPYAIAEATADLTTLFEQAQFLADWPLVHIESTRWDTFRGTAMIRFRQLMGDHAIVPHQVTERQSNDLEQSSLYMIDSEYRWHLLRPFLVGGDCPVCKNWSTFHVDRDDQGALVIKSLEHGHTDKADSISEPLRYVGLL
jgi:hypothetical protein